MAIPAPTLPNYTIPQQAPPNLLGMAQQAGTLREMNMQQNAQQQLLPLQVQEQQEKAKQAALATQQQQMQLAGQKAMMDAVTKGDLNKFIGVDTPDGSGVDAQGMYTHLISKGAMPEQASGFVTPFQTIAKNNSEIRKNNSETGTAYLKQRADSHQQVAEDIAEIMKMPAEKQGPAWAEYQQTRKATPLPGMDPQDVVHIQQATPDQLPALVSLLKMDAAIDTYHAEAAKKQAEATKGQLEVAAPSKDQLSTFTDKTIPSFKSLSAEQQGAFTSEAKTARTVPELNAIEARADATDKAEQMHADSLAQTKALIGTKFNEKGSEEIGKFWTDPHTGYAGALAQAKQTINSIKAGADGNGLLTSMIPTMEVLGINHAAGISRISPAEAQAAGLPGSWAERWNAWATKAMSGKLSPQLAQEGQQLMSIVTDAAYTRALTSSAYSAHQHNMAPNETTVMDRDGNWTTLDKATPPSGATAKSYSQADVDRAVAAGHGSAADIDAAFKAKGWTKK